MEPLLAQGSPLSRRAARPRIPLVFLLVTALLTGLLTALTATVGAAPAHAAAIDRTVLTWNMQGAGEGRNDPAQKWEVLKNPLMSDAQLGKPDIALIQEGGPMDVPNSAKDAGAMTPVIINGQNEPITQVQHTTWKVNTKDTYHIYRVDWDVDGHRVNPTIVTREPAQQTILIGRVGAGTRPVLGVRFGNDVYFTMHAAQNGNDAEAQAGRAWTWAKAQNPQYNIVVGGDFNKEPKDLGNLNGMTLHNQGQKTHTGGKELDYLLAGNVNQPGKTNPERIREPGRFSDHSPVLFTPDHRCAWGATSAARGARSAAAEADGCQEAMVSMGDSYISGEAGRWQGNGSNGQYSTKAKDGSSYGTDRTALNCSGSGNDEKCEHDPKRVYGDTGEGKEQCHRSDVAEIKSIGDGLGIPAERRLNIACSGATTEDILTRTFKGEKPQLEQLASLSGKYRLKYVVLSIGGNDLGFSKIARDCVLGYEVNRPCSDKGRGEMGPKLAKVQDAVGKTVDAIQKTLAESGQKTKIIIQGYPNPVPSALNVRYENKAWLREMSGGCPLTDKDVDWLHYEVVPGLNHEIASVAEREGVIFLDPLAALAGHQLCGQGAAQADDKNTLANPPDPTVSEWVRWIPGLSDGLPWTQGETQEAAHPNAFGQQAMGTCLRQTIEKTKDYADGYFACAGSRGMGPGDVRVSEKKPAQHILIGETHRMVLRNSGSGDLVDADWGGSDSYVRGEEEGQTDKQAWDVTAYEAGGETTKQNSDEPQPILADITVKRGGLNLASSEAPSNGEDPNADQDEYWAQLAKNGRHNLNTWALSKPERDGSMQYLYLRTDADGKRKVGGCLTQNPEVMTDKDRKSWLTVEPCGAGPRQNWWLESPGPLPNPRPAPDGWEDRGTGQIASSEHGSCIRGGVFGTAGLADCEDFDIVQQWEPTAQVPLTPPRTAGKTAKTAKTAKTQTAPKPTANDVFFLVNSASKDCLSPLAGGQSIVVDTCTNSAAQQWAWQGRTLRSVDSGQCLVTDADADLSLADCVDVPDALKGGIEPKDASRVVMRSATGLAMELPGGDTTAGKKIVGAAPAPGQDSQTWDLHADAGPYGIWRVAPKLIDSRHLSYNVIDKVAALMDAVADNKGEQWRLEKVGGGWYRVVNNLDGTVLTASGAGEPLALKEPLNNLGQWWRFDCTC
ncbi:GDSL-type esterase/lipase family protein [Streptomyces sp. NPDC004732]|uniref:GDSL-type esterase/lipase family protein n=1 Tax=Streptomyces sp. NPDC004732 TaxID=3154290 RepID=UPI0033AB9CBF